MKAVLLDADTLLDADILGSDIDLTPILTAADELAGVPDRAASEA